MKIYLLLFALVAAHAHADWELILDDHTSSIASDGERLYAATEDGIYYSRDDGDTWRRSNYKDYVQNLTALAGAVYGFSWKDGVMQSVTKGNT